MTGLFVTGRFLMYYGHPELTEEGIAIVAAGTTIADRPPHGSVQARLRTRLLPGMSGGEAPIRIARPGAFPQSHAPSVPGHTTSEVRALACWEAVAAEAYWTSLS